jgi:putative FmdB family regulatory protein
MPTYQYACTDTECGNRFELVQSFTDPAASECPVCQGPVRKVYSSVGVVFKGSGFYRTDSRAAANGSESGKPKSSESRSSESKSSESKSSESKSSESKSSGSSGSKSGDSTSASSAPAKAAASA